MKRPVGGGETPNLSLAPVARVRRGSRGSIERWWRSHPDKLVWVEEWLRRLADGTTDWSLPEVHAELNPPFTISGLQGWLRTNRPELWQRAMR